MSKKIFLKGEDKTNNVLRYKRVGNKYKVTFTNNKTFTYNANNVRIVESALKAPKSKECFDYLKRIATEIGLKIKINDEKSLNALEHNYSKIDFVMPDSILNSFLSGKLPPATPYQNINVTDKIYPFGFNGSQKEAVDKAIANKLSIIEGPPGTGKTQTILNIIANAIIKGNSVAVVSSNNSATKNILDKLQSYGVDFVVAYLGNTTNKNDFINSQKPLPDMKDWKLTPKEMTTRQEDLKSRFQDLEKKLVQRNELSSLRQELSTVEIEEKHFIEYMNSIEDFTEPQILQRISTSERALEMWLFCESYKEPQKSGKLMTAIRYVLGYLRFWDNNGRLVRKLFEQYPRDLLIAMLQRLFYKLKISELTRSISTLADELNQFNFDTKIDLPGLIGSTFCVNVGP